MGQKKAAQTRLSLHLSDCHLVGHQMSVIGQFTLIGMNIIRLLRCVFIAIVFSNSLDPDQTRQSVCLALGLKY